MASSSHLDVILVGGASSIVRRSAPALCNLLLSRFKCEPQILGLDLDLDLDRPSSRPRVVQERRLEATLPSGVRVSVWRGDLTDFKAVAVVNAANSGLQHYGGLALALSEAGGLEVQQESNEYVKNHGKVKTGEAVALGAGKLKCKTIIHAVGPNLSFKPNTYEVSAAKHQLEKVVCSVLNIVDSQKLDTVAIPAISSGIFNFPVDQCANVIVTTIKKYYESSSSNRFRPNEVFLVNNDDPTVKEMEWACKTLLSQYVSYGQAAASGNKPHTSGALSYSQTAASGNKPHTSGALSYSQAAASNNKPQTSVQTRGAKNQSVPSEVQLGMVQVLLRRGHLEEQKMDVIVNTIGSDRILNVGQVSKTLLRKAGQGMQDEIYKVPRNGTVLITKGHGLDCKEVHHVCCPYKSMFGSEQMLFQSVMDCLVFTIAYKRQSIAFPAIGTGNLGFRDEETANIMMHAVWTFAQNCPLPLEVHFVIFPSDKARFKTFEAELKHLRSKAVQMEPPGSAAAQNLNSNQAQTSPHERVSGAALQDPHTEPCIRLKSSSEQDRAEAEAWLQRLLYNPVDTVCISNNFTQLLGEKELDELSLMEVEGVQVEEFLEKGRSGLVVSGNRAEDIAETALKLQQMLQKVQRQYLKEQVKELKAVAQRVDMEKKMVSRSDPQLDTIIKQLHRVKLHCVKAERVENAALEKQFRLQKAQMPSHSSFDLLQIVSAQFCDMVGYIGFRPECAPPDDSDLGEGLYFAADVKTALNVWPDRTEQFVYLFVAEVLKGKSGKGRPGLVLAPDVDSGPGTRCDSVEGSGITVIFNHRQAVPRFLLTCCRDTHMTSL